MVGPLPVTVQGNRHILTFQDDLRKYVVAVPVEKQDAETKARAIVERIVLLYGTPQIVQKDQGSDFMSEVFRDTCSLLKIKPSAWGYLKPSQYCDVGRFLYGIFKF